METLYRMAKPGAIVFFEVPNCSDAYFESSHWDQPHTYFFTISAIERLAEKKRVYSVGIGRLGTFLDRIRAGN